MFRKFAWVVVFLAPASLVVSTFRRLRARRIAATAVLASAVGLGLLITPASPATAVDWKACGPNPYWYRLEVFKASCTAADRVVKKVQTTVPSIPPGGRWSGKVGRWSCTVAVGPSGGSILECWKGANGIRERVSA